MQTSASRHSHRRHGKVSVVLCGRLDMKVIHKRKRRRNHFPLDGYFN